MEYWWHEPMRVLQDNLQVMDTPLMNPQVIAQETADLHANALVVNVGGIYAWYPSKVPYHHINEYLPGDRDLLGELIEACHNRGIRLIARFDFSKTDDYVSQEHPEWFVRNADGSRRAYGAERPGSWSILYTTCANAGYRNETVAMPVLAEVLDRYDIDGIFLNSPGYDYCTCEACRKKYLELYGKPLPISKAEAGEETFAVQLAPRDLEPDFGSRCYHDNIANLYGVVKAKRPELPFILYYGITGESIARRLETADMLCTEAQNVLSRGWQELPPLWKPTLVMKMGRGQPAGSPKPFGIIHSCPGMDWRHTGMPQVEYQSWLRQIPAAGGTLWHSVTGFNATITDKRILSAVESVNADIQKIERDMDGAADRSDVLLLWNDEKTYGWATLLTGTQTLFDIRSPEQLTEETVSAYPVVILPDGYPLTQERIGILRRYTENGGRLVVEGTSSEQLLPFADVLGIQPCIRTSEALTACYWQFEEAGSRIRNGFEQTPILPHRGVTAYVRALPGTEVLATLIPPFAPLNSVGAPPERASMLVKHTDLALCTHHRYGKGESVLFSGRISELADRYRLYEFFALWSNMLDALLGSKRGLQMPVTQGIFANAYVSADGKRLLYHFVNGIGARPLMTRAPWMDFRFRIPLPKGRKAVSVEAVIEQTPFTWRQEEDSCLQIAGNRLELWEMFRITLA